MILTSQDELLERCAVHHHELSSVGIGACEFEQGGRPIK
jgi:hypothetical protein